MSYYPHGKRALDLLLSVPLILLSSWIFLLVLIAYILAWQWPLFFVQKRIGKNHRPFNLIKFRTLDRVTKLPFALGSFLRQTSLDELPQLFQVVTGKLSLAGPRPLPPEYLPLYSVEQRRRHDVLPGITGWAQVNGRHQLSWQRKFELDLEYIDHLSLAMDFRIFRRTATLLFTFKKDRSLEEQKFTGN